MRRAAWAVAAWCLASGASQAAEDKAVKEAVDRAVAALGGEKALAQAQGLTWKVAGTVDVNAVKADVSGDWSAQGLDRFRWDVTFTVMGRTEQVALCFNGEKGWATDGQGRTNDLPKEIVAAFVANLRCLRLVQNPLLLRGAGVKLSPLGELKVNDRDAVGLKVARKGQPEFDLYFDKKTGLPLKSEFRIKEGDGALETTHSFLFDAYKEFGDAKHFSKVKFLRDGTAHVELECSDVKPQEKLDDSLFEKPPKN